jgi:hypothetical protein
MLSSEIDMGRASSTAVALRMSSEGAHGLRRSIRAQLAADERPPESTGAASARNPGDCVSGPVTGLPTLTPVDRDGHSQCIALREGSLPELI